MKQPPLTTPQINTEEYIRSKLQPDAIHRGEGLTLGDIMSTLSDLEKDVRKSHDEKKLELLLKMKIAKQELLRREMQRVTEEKERGFDQISAVEAVRAADPIAWVDEDETDAQIAERTRANILSAQNDSGSTKQPSYVSTEDMQKDFLKLENRYLHGIPVLTEIKQDIQHIGNSITRFIKNIFGKK